MAEPSYLVRYGSMANVSRFRAGSDISNVEFERGDWVVIVTNRGTELGEVLARRVSEHRSEDGVSPSDLSILRRASSEDLARGRLAQSRHAERFSDCETILVAAEWPGTLIDVEPLLDDITVVLHYIAFEAFDEGVLKARFRVMRELEVIMEAIGGEPLDGEPRETAASGGSCGSCSSGGCSSGGGCSLSGGCGASARKRVSAEMAAGPVSDRGSEKSGCETCSLGGLAAKPLKAR